MVSPWTTAVWPPRCDGGVPLTRTCGEDGSSSSSRGSAAARSRGACWLIVASLTHTRRTHVGAACPYAHAPLTHARFRRAGAPRSRGRPPACASLAPLSLPPVSYTHLTLPTICSV
eukprot:364218-Prymnesium_polylepis.1